MHRIKIDDFTGYNFLSSPKFSPDGRKLAFIVKKADLEENDYTSRLWVYNLAEERLYKLTSGKRDGSFTWLDEENILFVSKRDSKGDDTGSKKNKEGREIDNKKGGSGEGIKEKEGKQEGEKDKAGEEEAKKTELYKININGGEADHFATIPVPVKKFKVLNEKTLIFTGVADLKEEKSKKEKEEEKDYEVLDEIPFWSNGEGFTNGKRIHLFTYDLEEKKLRDLTEGYFNVIDFDFTGDLACINMREFKDKVELYSDIYLCRLGDGRLEKMTGGKLNIGFVNFKDKETLIFSASDMKAMGLNTNKEIYELDIESGEMEKKTDMDRSLWTSVGTDSRLGGGETNLVRDGKLYFLTTEGYNCYLNVLEGGQVRRIIDQEGSVDMFDIYGDIIAYVAFREYRLQEIYLYRDGEETQLTGFNEEVLADKQLSRPEHFIVKASDGCELDAWVMRPADFEEGRKYPTILEIHGGPKTVYGTIFFHEFQVLASRGYALVFCNPRGSDGRGNEFADIRGRYGTRDYQDLMEVLDAAIERYDFIDPDRLGVAGGSYGGYMTNWIIGHTDRFKAAVTQRSISNWISMYGTTDIGYFFTYDQLGGTPWENCDYLWDSSPLKYADKITTPTLIIHSDQDYRCWLPEGIQLFTALKYHGVESRMVIFKGENHELSRSGKPKHRIRRLQEMVQWFDKYLKDGLRNMLG